MTLLRCLSALVMLGLLPVHAEQTITRLGSPGAFQVQVNPITGKAYVATGAGLGVIDAATHTITLIGTDSSVAAIAVDPAANRIFATRAEGTGAVDVIDGTTHAITRVALGSQPREIVVNAVTGEAYVTTAAGVVVIDGATRATTSLMAGANPFGVAVNPATNKAYVGNGGDVWVIDGATKAAAVFASGASPSAVAVNPVTNKVYAFSNAATSLLEIDGATGASVPIPVGGTDAMMLNPVTNKIYVARAGPFIDAGGEVTVVDGVTRVATPIPSLVGNPIGFALNPVTNTIYVRGLARGNTDVMVIDGATNAARSFSTGPQVAFGSSQAGMAINPVTNMLYVSHSMLGVDVVDASANLATTIPMPGGAVQRVLAVNPITGKVYVAHAGGTTVTVLDETSLATTDVTVGTNPVALAVNPATDRIFVANQDSNTVSVIEGATNAVTTVTVPFGPTALAVNTVTNKAYVATAASVTVIDGTTLSTTNVATAPGAPRIVVNESTNRVYVLRSDSSSITEIDGHSLAATTIPVGVSPMDIAVNAVTNRIYVANFGYGSAPGSSTVSIIDGASRLVTSVPTPIPWPNSIVVNPVADKIYVGIFYAGGLIQELDGVSHAWRGVIWGALGDAAIDTVANKIYIADPTFDQKIIDGATNTISMLPIPRSNSAAVNPVTNRVYFAHFDKDHITVLRPSVQALVNHDVDVMMAGLHTTSTPSPGLALSVCCPYAPDDPAVRTVYFRRGSAQGPFAPATATPSGPFATVGGLQPGLNYVTLFAVDAMEGTSFQARGGSSAMIGAPRAFPVVYAPPTLMSMGPLAPATVGGAYNHALQVSGGTGPFTFSMAEGILPAGMTLSPGGVLSGTPTVAGFFTFTIRAMDSRGGITTAVFALSAIGSNPPRLGNISTRARSLGGDDVLIGGFVIGGSTSKTVVVRARGPSLTLFGVANVLANPFLQLFASPSQPPIALNDDWISAANAPALSASGYAPANPLESAILVTLAPGAYTAIVSSSTGGTGVAIVEVFELDQPESPLANISTRSVVLTGGDVMIGGFVVQGSGPQTVVVRARGPSLGPFGIVNPLGNPHLQLVRSSDQTSVAANDNWINAPNVAAIQASGFAPSNLLESAILVTLDPGAYTAIVSGVGGTTGVGIVEVFTLP